LMLIASLPAPAKFCIFVMILLQKS
jgi:hypothetical protein